MIIRSHSICLDGIERFSDNLITITSCTNHSGVHNNDAVLLVVQKKLIISPKIIKPLPQGQSNIHWLDTNISNIPTAANSSVRRERTPARKRLNMQWGLSCQPNSNLYERKNTKINWLKTNYMLKLLKNGFTRLLYYFKFIVFLTEKL